MIVTPDVAAGPNVGAASADQVNLPGSSSRLSTPTSVVGQYTFSIWIRLVTGAGDFAFDYYGAATNSDHVQKAVATSAWQRFSWTFAGDGAASSYVAIMHSFDQLFSGNTLTYVGGSSISWNVFNAPQVSAQVAEARASSEEARQNYRKTVLAALLDAENSLSRFGHQRDDVEVLAGAKASASHAAELSNQRVAGGTSNLIDTLDIERQRIQSQSSLAQGQAQLTTNWVALQGSLGLGWGTTQVVAER